MNSLLWRGFALLLAGGLTGCGFMETAGGSVGTDNPAVTVVVGASEPGVGDSVSLEVRFANQNPIASPAALVDTMMAVGDKITLNGPFEPKMVYCVSLYVSGNLLKIERFVTGTGTILSFDLGRPTLGAETENSVGDTLKDSLGGDAGNPDYAGVPGDLVPVFVFLEGTGLVWTFDPLNPLYTPPLPPGEYELSYADTVGTILYTSLVRIGIVP